MNHFNYLGDVRATRFARWPTLGTIAIDNRIRGPLAALLATLVVTGACGTVQITRLHEAERAYAASAAHQVQSDRDVEDVKVLRARVAAKRRLGVEIAEFRRSTLERTNELAWIGNRLPADTWLRTLRYENGGYSLEGTSSHVAAVGTTMLALRGDTLSAQPQLVSLRDDVAAGPAHVRYTLRLEAHR